MEDHVLSTRRCAAAWSYTQCTAIHVLYGADPNPEGREVLVEQAEQAGLTPQWRPSRKSR